MAEFLKFEVTNGSVNFSASTLQETGAEPFGYFSEDPALPLENWPRMAYGVTAGRTVYFYGRTNNTCHGGRIQASGTGTFKVSGNLAAILNPNNPPTKLDQIVPSSNVYDTDPSPYGCFERLFWQMATPTIDASGLTCSIKFDGDEKYYKRMFLEMFWGCKNLIAIPTSLNSFLDFAHGEHQYIPEYGCACMFEDCTSLPAIDDDFFDGINLSKHSCCASMFHGCSSLTAVPPKMLWSTPSFNPTESSYTYETGYTGLGYGRAYVGQPGNQLNGMFAETGVKKVPSQFFWPEDCDKGTYGVMFAQCPSLTEMEENAAPNLTKVGAYGFQALFYQSQYLEKVGKYFAHKVTKMGYGCFRFMFYSDYRFEKLPMFFFPGGTEDDSFMEDNTGEAFDQCFVGSAVRDIAVFWHDWSSSRIRDTVSVALITSDWVKTVPGSGTFRVPEDSLIGTRGDNDRGNNKIPYNWNIKHIKKFSPILENTCLQFKAMGGSITVTLNPSQQDGTPFYLSVNPEDPYSWEENTITAKEGQTVYLRGTQYPSKATVTKETANKITITGDGYPKLGGSMISLVDDGQGTSTTISMTSGFGYLFSGINFTPKNTAKSTAKFLNTEETTLPAGLLPATTLADQCYIGLFADCKGLGTLPENFLPAEEVPSSAYEKMFMGSDLQAAPLGSIKMTKTSTNSCKEMFKDAENLNEIGVLFESWETDKGSFTDWVSGVSENGTFICPQKLKTVRGNSNMPTKWTPEKIIPPHATISFGGKVRVSGI